MKVIYKRFDRATVSAEMWVLLTRCRALGWPGGVNGARGGARTYAMQKALWLLWLSGRGAPAFNPATPDPQHKRRHMRSTIETLGGWSNAVDVSDAEGLIVRAARLGVTLHRPYDPPEAWHVEALRRFKLGGGEMDDPKRLARLLKAHGVVNPNWTILAASRAKLPLHYACACIEKESGKGHNVFGHDPTIFVGRGTVTRKLYQAYLVARRASGNRQMQGIGPCQLTWWATQDAADRIGGCHKPLPNMTVGFTALRALIQKYGVEKGAAAYNGSGPAAAAYGRDFVAKAAKWKAILS